MGEGVLSAQEFFINVAHGVALSRQFLPDFELLEKPM